MRHDAAHHCVICRGAVKAALLQLENMERKRRCLNFAPSFSVPSFDNPMYVLAISHIASGTNKDIVILETVFSTIHYTNFISFVK